MCVMKFFQKSPQKMQTFKTTNPNLPLRFPRFHAKVNEICKLSFHWMKRRQFFSKSRLFERSNSFRQTQRWLANNFRTGLSGNLTKMEIFWRGHLQNWRESLLGPLYLVILSGLSVIILTFWPLNFLLWRLRMRLFTLAKATATLLPQKNFPIRSQLKQVPRFDQRK